MANCDISLQKLASCIRKTQNRSSLSTDLWAASRHSADYRNFSMLLWQWWLPVTFLTDRVVFHSKIFSRNVCIAEIVLLVRISSWNFVRVPKVILWAHVQSFSLKFSKEMWFQASSDVLILRYFWSPYYTVYPIVLQVCFTGTGAIIDCPSAIGVNLKDMWTGAPVPVK